MLASQHPIPTPTHIAPCPNGCVNLTFGMTTVHLSAAEFQAFLGNLHEFVEASRGGDGTRADIQ